MALPDRETSKLESLAQEQAASEQGRPELLSRRTLLNPRALVDFLADDQQLAGLLKKGTEQLTDVKGNVKHALTTEGMAEVLQNMYDNRVQLTRRGVLPAATAAVWIFKKQLAREVLDLLGVKEVFAEEFIADTKVISFRGIKIEVFENWRPIIFDSVVPGGLSTDRERFPQTEAQLFGALINGTIRNAKEELTLVKWANARSALEKITGFTGFIDLVSLNQRELAPEKIIFEGQAFQTLTGVAWKGRTTDGRTVRMVKVDAPDNFKFPMILARDKTIANRNGFRRGETHKNLQGLLKDRGEFLFFAEIFTPDGQLQHQIMVRSACGNAGGKKLEVIILETATPAPTPTAGPEIKPPETPKPEFPFPTPTPGAPPQAPETVPTATSGPAPLPFATPTPGASPQSPDSVPTATPGAFPTPTPGAMIREGGEKLDV